MFATDSVIIELSGVAISGDRPRPVVWIRRILSLIPDILRMRIRCRMRQGSIGDQGEFETRVRSSANVRFPNQRD